MGNWSNLPIDLLLLIGKYGTIGDKLRLPAICTNWGAHLKENILLFPSGQEELPWLLIPMEYPRCGFYSILGERVYCPIDIPEAYSNRCCGSSHGWMVMTGITPSVFMFNPLTRSRIELPTLIALPHVMTYCPSNGDEYTIDYGFTASWIKSKVEFRCSFEMKTSSGIRKAVLSGDPCLEKDHLVIMISYTEYGFLGFCRRGDIWWTEVITPEGGIDDIVYWKDKESFYSITPDGRLSCYKFHGPDAPAAETVIYSSIPRVYDYNYLVVAEGELLLVARQYNRRYTEKVFQDMVHCGGHCDILQDEEEEDDDEVYFKYGTRAFKVYRADLEKKTWTEVKDLGNRALFVGVNSSMSFDVADFPGCKRNHIYFTNDLTAAEGAGDLYAWKKDLGAMDLQTCKLSPFPGCSRLKPSTMAIPIWMNPSLKTSSSCR